jgi:hypothetical protein
MAIALAKSFVVSVFPVPIQQHWLHHDHDVNKKLNLGQLIRHSEKKIHLMEKSINSVSQKTEDIMDEQQLPPGIHKKLRLLGSSPDPKSMDHAAGENPRRPIKSHKNDMSQRNCQVNLDGVSFWK